MAESAIALDGKGRTSSLAAAAEKVSGPPGRQSSRQSLGARSGPKRPQLGGHFDGVAFPDVVGVTIRAGDHEVQQPGYQDDGQPDSDHPSVQEGARVAGF